VIYAVCEVKQQPLKNITGPLLHQKWPVYDIILMLLQPESAAFGYKNQPFQALKIS
jgi:hypothetical protein